MKYRTLFTYDIWEPIHLWDVGPYSVMTVRPFHHWMRRSRNKSTTHISSIWTEPANKQYTQPNQDIFPLEHSYQKYLPYLKIKSIAYITTQHRCYLQNDASPFWGGEVLCHWPVWHDTNELISCCANKIATDFNLYKKTSSDTYRI